MDLLVAVALTSIPRNLFQQAADSGESDAVSDQRREEECMASMEQICFNAACISSDVLRKHFQNANAIDLQRRSSGY